MTGQNRGGNLRNGQTGQNVKRASGNPRAANARQVSRRRPNTPRRKKNGDTFLWILLAAVAIAVVIALVFLVKVIGNKKDPGQGSETTGENVKTVETSPGETDPVQTGADVTDPATEPVTLAPETQAPSDPTVPTFTADLSAYEMYMNPQGSARDAYLILVNPWNALKATDVPPDLVDVKSTRKDGRNTQKLREYAAKALEALMIEAEACGMVRKDTPSGYPLSVMSAYRTYEYQGSLFETYVNSEMSSRGISRSEAEAIVVTYSCRPGTSEHQTGLCVDMHTLPAADDSFRYQPEATWLAENCWKFGFILRFPENKTDVTGITYEPWHFRYVGRYHAEKMRELGMCLEEYVEYLKK